MPAKRLEVITAFDRLDDALIDEIVCNLPLGLCGVEQPERVTILNEEKPVIVVHEVDELSLDQVVADLGTLPGAGEVDLGPVLGQSASPESHRAKHAAKRESP